MSGVSGEWAVPGAPLFPIPPAPTQNAGKELPDLATVAEAATPAKARSAAPGDNIGFVALPPKGAAKRDDGDGFTKLPAKGITAEDRRAYTDALPGTPEGMKAREGIEGRYGGRGAFVKEYDPAGEALGASIPALALIAAGAGAPAAVGTAATALGSPALRAVAAEVIKWLGRGALGAGGFEAVRRATGQK